MLASYFHSLLAKHQYKPPRDSTSVGALQFSVAVRATQWGRISEVRKRTREDFSLQFFLQGFVQPTFKWLKQPQWFGLWHFGRVWNKLWQRCYDWRAGFVLSEMCGKCLSSFSQSRIGSSESHSLNKLSKTSKRIEICRTTTLSQTLLGSLSSV